MNTISKIMMIVICSAIAIIVVVVFIIGKNDYKDNKSQSNNNSNDTTIDSSYETNNETDNNYNNLFIISDKKVNLNNGIKMPILGLGTWTLTISETEETVYNAIKVGFRLIDTAEYYGNEEGVGKGVKKCIQEGIIKREDIFITSKIMPDAYSNPDFAIEDSLKNLDVDYIDLMLIHQPGNNDENVYKSMEKYYKNGKLKSIGISNYYTKSQIDKILSYATIIPSIIQNENHIYYQNNELQNYVKQYGIIIESWYPLGGREHTSESFNNTIIKDIANKYNKTSAQIIIRWHLQAGYIVIPGSKSSEHIKENYNVFDFELSSEDMKEISKINKNKRYENW